MRIFSGVARRGRRVRIALALALLAGLSSVLATAPAAQSAATTSGYWLVGTDGGIFSFGKASFHGSTGAIKLNQPIVGMAATPDGKGYWMVASDGGIFAFGTAKFHGSMGGKPLNKPIVGMASTRTGQGYWLVASDGGIFAFGDAGFFGSTGNLKLNKPIVDIVPTATGRGYWMAASDGGIFAFGDAGFFGSTGAINLTKRIQQMAATPTGKGYWMVAGDGGIFAFGDAGFHGSAVEGAEKRVVDMAPSASGKGYYITASNGAVYAYGDATPYGGLEKTKLAHGIIAMVAMNGGGEPPVAVDDLLNIDEDGSGSIDVLGNDRDPDGTPLSIQSVSGSARGGQISVNGTTVTYKPAPDINGNDSFSYTVVDGAGNTAVGNVTVLIRARDDLPVPVEDTITIPLGQTVTINVLGNDIGLGDELRLLELALNPSKGKARIADNGHAIIYTAEKRGSDTLRYRVWDRDNDNADGVVKITVVGPDPQAFAPDVTDECRTDCEVDVLAEGGTLGDNGKIRLVNPSQPGVALNGSKISFSGGGAPFTDVAVAYQIVDDNNGANPEQVADGTVTFRYRNVAPTGTTETVGPSPTGVYQLHGQDGDNDALTFFIDGTPPPYFNSFDGATGAFRFDGAPPGQYVITFHVSDGAASSGVETFTINII